MQDDDEIGTGNEFDQAFEIIRKANAPEDVYNLKICITYIDKEQTTSQVNLSAINMPVKKKNSATNFDDAIDTPRSMREMGKSMKKTVVSGIGKLANALDFRKSTIKKETLQEDNS